MTENQKENESLGDRTKISKVKAGINVQPIVLPDLSKICVTDWRVYVDGRIQRLELALESIVECVAEDTKKKAELFDRIRGIWQRVLGEFPKNKRNEAFGMRVLKLMQIYWRKEENDGADV